VAAEAAADPTSVETVAVDAATREVPQPDSDVKIVGQISVDWGSVAPERAATVLLKKFWNLPFDGVMTCFLLLHCRKQVQDVHRRLAARQAQPSLEAEGFEEQVDCRVQSQQCVIEFRGQLDGRGSPPPLSLSSRDRRLLLASLDARRASSVLSVPSPPRALSAVGPVRRGARSAVVLGITRALATMTSAAVFMTVEATIASAPRAGELIT
jgi:hypothetical protein